MRGFHQSDITIQLPNIFFESDYNKIKNDWLQVGKQISSAIRNHGNK